MKRLILMAAMAGCGGGESDLHAVIDDCSFGGPCERACQLAANPRQDETCPAHEADGAAFDCPDVRTVDGVDGCCYSDADGVVRFAECE